MKPIDIVNRFYEEFGQGNLDNVLSLFHEDATWTLVGSKKIPYFGEYKGPTGIAAFFEKLFETEDVIEFEPTDFIADDKAVVVLGKERCTAKATGKEFSAEWAQIFWVKDGKITAWKEIIDTYPMVMAYTGTAQEAA